MHLLTKAQRSPIRCLRYLSTQHWRVRSCPADVESSGFPLVVVHQPTEVCAAADRPDLSNERWARRRTGLAQWHVSQRLVWSKLIVIVRVDLNDVVEMAQAEAEEVIQTLSF